MEMGVSAVLGVPSRPSGAPLKCSQQLQTKPKVPLHIGPHICEIFFEDGKVFGDGVNVVLRIQSPGIANSILFSSGINNKLKNQTEFKSVQIGRFQFKNVDEPMEVFALTYESFIVPDKKKSSRINSMKSATRIVLDKSRSWLYSDPKQSRFLQLMKKMNVG